MAVDAQMSLLPEPSEEAWSPHRAEALAGVLVGFVYPGYSSWSKVPGKVQTQARSVAQMALQEMRLRHKTLMEGRGSS